MFRAPYSVLNSSDVDTGKGSRYGAVNCNTSVVAPGTPNLKYAHAPMLERLPNGSLAAAWQVLLLPFLWTPESCPVCSAGLELVSAPPWDVQKRMPDVWQGSDVWRVCFGDPEMTALGETDSKYSPILFKLDIVSCSLRSKPVLIRAKNCKFPHRFVADPNVHHARQCARCKVVTVGECTHVHGPACRGEGGCGGGWQSCVCGSRQDQRPLQGGAGEGSTA